MATSSPLGGHNITPLAYRQSLARTIQHRPKGNIVNNIIYIIGLIVVIIAILSFFGLR
jgi:small-conductance mechanosensitive channel